MGPRAQITGTSATTRLIRAFLSRTENMALLDMVRDVFPHSSCILPWGKYIRGSYVLSHDLSLMLNSLHTIPLKGMWVVLPGSKGGHTGTEKLKNSSALWVFL